MVHLVFTRQLSAACGTGPLPEAGDNTTCQLGVSDNRKQSWGRKQSSILVCCHCLSTFASLDVCGSAQGQNGLKGVPCSSPGSRSACELYRFISPREEASFTMEQTRFFVSISIGLLPIRSCFGDRRPTLFLWPQNRVTGGKGGLEREGGAAVMRAGDEGWREREGQW